MVTPVAVPVQRTEVDGVPVLWVDTPGRLHAELLFGVGIADETLLTNGITHLVEHLVMRRLGDVAHAANAGVTVHFTSFEATSSPAVVAEHLRRLCAAVADPDLDALERERGVLEAEDDDAGVSVLTEWPLSLRYGNRGPGLVGAPPFGRHLVDATAVSAWARRWLHRGNAVLVLDGPPPDGLTLPLPTGPTPSHTRPRALAPATPAWEALPLECVALSMHAPWSAALATGLQVLDDRLTRRLRHETGLVYEVGAEINHLADGTASIGIGVPVRDEHVATVCGHLTGVLDELCRDGPSAAELELDRQRLCEALGDERELAWQSAFDAAVERLTGMEPSERSHAPVLAGLDPVEVARALTAARRSLVVAVPDGHEVPGLPELAPAAVPTRPGRTFTRALFGSGVPRRWRLVVGPDALTLRRGDGSPDPVHVFDDVVGVGIDVGPKGEGDEVLVVHGGDGRTAIVRARDWRDGRAATDAIRAAVAPELFYPVPEPLRLCAE